MALILLRAGEAPDLPLSLSALLVSVYVCVAGGVFHTALSLCSLALLLLLPHLWVSAAGRAFLATLCWSPDCQSLLYFIPDFVLYSDISVSPSPDLAHLHQLLSAWAA